jgi:hypothetical protein
LASLAPVARRAAGLIPLCLCLASPALGQGTPPADPTFAEAPAAGPGWLPRISQLGRIPLTDAERAEIVAVANGIEAALRRVPRLARPDGFEIEPIMIWWDSFSDADHLLTWMYRLRIWVPNKATRVEPAGRVVITVNPYPEGLLDVPTRGVFGSFYEGGPFHTYLFAPHVTGTLPGGGLVYDGFEGETWFLHGVSIAGNEPFYVPVSRERVLLAELERYVEADSSRAAQGAGPSAYEQWLSEAPDRRAFHEMMVSQLLSMGRTADAAKAREDFERTERGVGERLKAQEPAMAKLAALPSPSVALRRQLEEASPAELQEQACFDRQAGYWTKDGDGGLTYAFVPPGSEGAQCLVAGNPAFYAARGNRAAPRIIDVWLETNDSDYMYAGLLNDVAVKIFQTLDWAALGGLVRVR